MLKRLIQVAISIVVVVFLANLFYYASNRSNVALIRLSGIITDAKAKKLIDTIRAVERDNGFKAALLVINSPGGSANASERLFIAIRDLNRKKPVVALIEDIGASGAYYAACGAGEIVAYPTSVVGSIGVLIESVNLSQLAHRIGISPFVIKSGKVKDVGNPLRKPTEADIEMLQKVVNGLYDQFLKDVAESRGISVKRLKPYADGSVFAASDALKIGLIDRIGTMQTARNLMKSKAHLSRVKLENLGESRGLLGSILGSRLSYLLSYFKLALTPIPEAIFDVRD